MGHSFEPLQNDLLLRAAWGRFGLRDLLPLTFCKYPRLTSFQGKRLNGRPCG